MIIGLDNITQQIIQRKSLHVLMDLEQADGIGRRLLAAGNYLLDGVYIPKSPNGLSTTHGASRQCAAYQSPTPPSSAFDAAFVISL